ncbi:MAG: alkaline phosphatase family protein [Anaerolineales bacterium]|uniref:alkaline phosphatase family protein n=1 Tax=Candidatus Villigracilis vicinus TaxID=3140679 RepID=UPI003134FE9A|nr:alkaline phosphatase family protein [Anaerolineales bacterium]
MHPSFIKPRYDSGGFAGTPQRIQEAFASKKYDAVVLFFVDAFGWRFFERFQEASFIKRIAKHGKVEKITSQFPSTTAAHVTTMHTGLNVGQSGVHEWYYYEPLVDRVIAPLLFSYAADGKGRDSLGNKIKPDALYPKGVFYPALSAMGVESLNYGIRDYTPSSYSKVVMRGSEIISFKTLSEALINLGLRLEKQTKPTFVHLYFDKIDAIAHEYGPASPQTEAEIETFLLMMENYFDRVFGSGKRILFLMTADHGMCEVDPQTTTYLNTDREFAGVERFIRSNKRGHLIVPAGSARDMFMYIKPDMLDEAQDFFLKRLEGKADVVKTETLIEAGYFGASVSERFTERAGNLILLPYRYESVWWYEKDRFEMKFLGHHGGLTPQEMETVLYSLEVG